MTSLFSLYERFFFVFSSQESAVLQGKLRPQPERDGKPQKVPLTGRSDVKLREKQKDFEQRDYQAQRVLNLRKTIQHSYVFNCFLAQYSSSFHNITTQNMYQCI